MASNDEWSVARQLGTVLTPVVPGCVIALFMVFTDVRADIGFFRAAASVIITLVLALALQGKLFRLARFKGWLKFYSLILFAFLGGGEAIALWRIANPPAPHHDYPAGAVTGAMVTGFIGVAIIAFFGDDESAAEQHSDPD